MGPPVQLIGSFEHKTEIAKGFLLAIYFAKIK